MSTPLRTRDDIPLAPSTTLELGGAARHMVDADDHETVVDALRWGSERDLPVAILGGGSNLVVPDDGYPGLVVRMAQRGVQMRRDGEVVRVVAQAGEPWDPLVARAVDEDLAGLECLSAIPGLVGATPIQNVGAYGQEIADTLVRVRALDRRSLETLDMTPAQCAFAYRDSVFKRHLGRWVVLEVELALRPGGEPTVRYAELERALRERGAAPTLAETRETVIALRRRKSMVIDPNDENRRSAGSFFTNPILPDGEAERVIRRAVELGVVSDPSEVPRYDAGEGRTKLAAGWLIERSGIEKGMRRGHVGVSSRHALALVHHGGGTTAELLALADAIRAAVRDRFGVELRREPVLLGPSSH